MINYLLFLHIYQLVLNLAHLEILKKKEKNIVKGAEDVLINKVVYPNTKMQLIKEVLGIFSTYAQRSICEFSVQSQLSIVHHNLVCLLSNPLSPAP